MKTKKKFPKRGLLVTIFFLVYITYMVPGSSTSQDDRPSIYCDRNDNRVIEFVCDGLIGCDLPLVVGPKDRPEFLHRLSNDCGFDVLYTPDRTTTYYEDYQTTVSDCILQGFKIMQCP